MCAGDEAGEGTAGVSQEGLFVARVAEELEEVEREIEKLKS